MAKFPFFVLGTQRSGTTLLYKILSASGEVFCWNEMFSVHEALFGSQQGGVDAFARQLSKRLRFADVQAGESRTDVFRRSMVRAAGDAGFSRWCLKDPRITYYLPQYAEAFPDAKFVVIVRDGRAVCRSYLDTSTFAVGRPSNAVAAGIKWRDEVKRQQQFLGQYPDRTLVVRYEDLITGFEAEVRRLADFLELDELDRMLRYYDQPSETAIHAGNKNVLTPPDPNRIHDWNSKLSEKQIRTIESISEEMLTQFQYELLYEPRQVSRLYSRIACLSDRIVQEIRWQKYKRSR
ncbi:sulfotransferase [Stieleria sp. JC731]|uniref:sulfotransferase family protein n=1 Tax=Pirellulaceae TaxID=2691357 RepID=UPI001E3705DE|nr:sulfotransferase [Stieleria sp. JC731]MCC9601455.1 sulfotransferase [Stieleria sp. JC731]